MRIIVTIALIGAAVAIWFLQTESESSGGPSEVKTTQIKTGEQAKPTRRIARDRVTPTPAKPKSEMSPKPVAVAPDEPPAKAATAVDTPKGPFTVDLGSHTIQLRDDARKRAVSFTLQVVTQTDETRKELRRRRRDLVRMAYFLGSKRQADGAVGSAGKARFERDLLERFQNVVRTGSIDTLKLKSYRIVSRALDAGLSE
jgi:flagellar basal body-associated protein FliL